MVCDARRTVNRRAKVGDETLANVRKVRVPVHTKNPVLKLAVRENAFGSQPAPPSSNQTATEEPPVLARERETCLGRNGTGGTDWP